MNTNLLLAVKIPMTAVGIITFVIVAGLGGIFLWWWFKKRNAGRVKIKTIVSGAVTPHEGQLHETGSSLTFIFKNNVCTRDVSNVRELVVKEATGPQVYNFQVELLMDQAPHLVLEVNHENKNFVNRVLEKMGKIPVDWNAPLPQLNKIGNLVVRGYRIKR